MKLSLWNVILPELQLHQGELYVASWSYLPLRTTVKAFTRDSQ